MKTDQEKELINLIGIKQAELIINIINNYTQGQIDKFNKLKWVGIFYSCVRIDNHDKFYTLTGVISQIKEFDYECGIIFMLNDEGDLDKYAVELE